MREEALQSTVRNISTKTICLQLAIAITVGGIYFTLCELTPLMSKTTLYNSIVFGKTIKVANVLRALCLVSPSALIGIGTANILFNISMGTISSGAYPVMPLVTTGIGLLIYKFYTFKSKFLDVGILFAYGAVIGLIVSFNHLMSLLTLGLGLPLLQVGSKMLLSGLTVAFGYPIVLLWRKRFS